ncbi:hypothetical protein GCM10010365_15010 [Streptomyces poonensis]|uniref:Uncharacterized protein n=1 Tax=Streptomyces poonensis TaxID=68255 RepID=A0A918PBT6_9ACTN|nr:hypothetical protein GCM10010365_15010 [Streptomyces poonensis]
MVIAEVHSREECLREFWDLAAVLALRYGLGFGEESQEDSQADRAKSGRDGGGTQSG